jgi:hypothetical protein
MLVELSGPTMFGRIGVMQALNRGHVWDFNSARKRYTWAPATAIVMHGQPVSHCPMSRGVPRRAKGPFWAPRRGAGLQTLETAVGIVRAAEHEPAMVRLPED